MRRWRLRNARRRRNDVTIVTVDICHGRKRSGLRVVTPLTTGR